MTFLNFPNKVWERGVIAQSGAQLWFSRIVTKEDRQRRLDYESRYQEREEIRRCGK